jgi:hypothetical protein
MKWKVQSRGGRGREAKSGGLKKSITVTFYLSSGKFLSQKDNS